MGAPRLRTLTHPRGPDLPFSRSWNPDLCENMVTLIGMCVFLNDSGDESMFTESMKAQVRSQLLLTWNGKLPKF